jgi:hypothetical protein
MTPTERKEQAKDAIGAVLLDRLLPAIDAYADACVAEALADALAKTVASIVRESNTAVKSIPTPSDAIKGMEIVQK